MISSKKKYMYFFRVAHESWVKKPIIPSWECLSHALPSGSEYIFLETWRDILED